MKKRYALLFALLITVLAACAELPEGEYVAFPGTPWTTPVLTAQQSGYHVSVLSGAPGSPTARVITTTPNPTYTPWIVTPTYGSTLAVSPVATVVSSPTQEPPIPTIATTAVPKCELRILDQNHVMRQDHSASAGVIVSIERLNYVGGIRFWYSLTSEEWSYVSWKNNNIETAPTYTGWIQVTSNVEYDPLGPCIDLPSEFETPPPTALPTSTPTPIITPSLTPVVCWIVSQYNVNVRPNPIVQTTPAPYGLLEASTGTQALAWNKDKTWYKIWWPPKAVYGWVSASLFTSTGPCGGLPIETPKS